MPSTMMTYPAGFLNHFFNKWYSGLRSADSWGGSFEILCWGPRNSQADQFTYLSTRVLNTQNQWQDRKSNQQMQRACTHCTVALVPCISESESNLGHSQSVHKPRHPSLRQYGSQLLWARIHVHRLVSTLIMSPLLFRSLACLEILTQLTHY